MTCLPSMSAVACVLAASTLAGAPVAALAEGDVAAGKAKAAVCGACHGPNGNSMNPEWPKLAGQHSVYLKNQLMAFKSGERKNALMGPQAANLSAQDMDDLAAYFAAQKPR